MIKEEKQSRKIQKRPRLLKYYRKHELMQCWFEQSPGIKHISTCTHSGSLSSSGLQWYSNLSLCELQCTGCTGCQSCLMESRVIVVVSHHTEET